MIVPDINLLLYVHDSASRRHQAARKWWEVLMKSLESQGVVHDRGPQRRVDFAHLRRYLPFEGAFPRPPPEGLPVVEGQFPPLFPPLPPFPPPELLDLAIIYLLVDVYIITSRSPVGRLTLGSSALRGCQTYFGHFSAYGPIEGSSSTVLSLTETPFRVFRRRLKLRHPFLFSMISTMPGWRSSPSCWV